MKKAFLNIVLVALILAACAGQPTASDQAAATNPAVTSPAADSPASTPTLAPSATTEAMTEATAQPTAPAAPTEAAQPAATDSLPVTGSGDLKTFVIIPEESSVTYQVGEVFLNQNNRFNTAVGITQVISGEVQIDSQNPQNSVIGDFTVDISQLKSDSSRRDSALRDRFLESARFPIATFKTTQVEGLPETYTPGQEVKFRLSGDLTIREMTRPVTFDVTARLEDDRLTGQAQTQFLMSEFGFGPIEILGMIETEDQVMVIFDFVAAPKT